MERPIYADCKEADAIRLQLSKKVKCMCVQGKCSVQHYTKSQLKCAIVDR